MKKIIEKFINKFSFAKKTIEHQNRHENNSQTYNFNAVGLGVLIVNFTNINEIGDEIFTQFNLQKGGVNVVSEQVFEQIIANCGGYANFTKNISGPLASLVDDFNNKTENKFLFASCIGSDELGFNYVKNLKDDFAIRLRKKSQTSRSITIGNTICLCVDELNFIDFDSLSLDVIKTIENSKTLVIDGLLFCNPHNFDAIEKICILAKCCNVKIIYYLPPHFASFVDPLLNTALQPKLQPKNQETYNFQLSYILQNYSPIITNHPSFITPIP